MVTGIVAIIVLLVLYAAWRSALDNGYSRHVGYVFQAIFIALSGCSGAVTILSGASSLNCPLVLWPLIEVPAHWAAQNVIVAAPVLTILAVCAKSIQERARKERSREIAKKVLNRVWDQVFGSIEGADVRSHRVTLYRKKSFCFVARQWPWSGWLVAFCRSGHLTQKNIHKFRVGDQDKGEGFTGVAWAKKGAHAVEHLDDLDSPIDPTDDAFIRYSECGDVSVQWLKDRCRLKKVNARSLYSVPVEANGRRWGLLVIDSRYEKVEFSLSEVTLAVSILGDVLESGT